MYTATFLIMVIQCASYTTARALDWSVELNQVVVADSGPVEDLVTS